MSQLPASKAPHKGSHPYNLFEAIFLGASQKVTIANNASNRSTQLGSALSVARICSDVDCFIAVGDVTVVATQDGTSMFLPAKTPQLIGVAAGQYLAVEGVAAGSAGSLYITEGSGTAA